MTFYRGPHGSAFGAQINEALSQQATRMERASAEEKARKAAVAATAAEAVKKRPLPTGPAADQPTDAKRLKVEVDNAAANSAAFLASFDFTTLPIALVTDLIVANLQAFTEPALLGLVQVYRQGREVAPQASPQDGAADEAMSISEAFVKDEPVDPLKMDIDEEEMEYEPDRLNEAVSSFLWHPIPIQTAFNSFPEVMKLQMRRKLSQNFPKLHSVLTFLTSNYHPPKTLQRLTELLSCAESSIAYVMVGRNCKKRHVHCLQAPFLTTCGCCSSCA